MSPAKSNIERGVLKITQLCVCSIEYFQFGIVTAEVNAENNRILPRIPLVKTLSDNMITCVPIVTCQILARKSEDKMATSKMREHLAPYQIKWIAKAISVDNLKHIAQTLMGFSVIQIDRIYQQSFSDDDIFKEVLLMKWAEMNSDLEQVRVRNMVHIDI